MSSHEDADPDDDGLKGLRSMWLSLPDEEPSTRGLDALMAAARVKAEEMAQPSLWERIVAMMRQPQVLALATIMILIGGAVLISQRRDKLEATHSASTPDNDKSNLERAHEQVPAAQTVSAPAPAGASNAPADEAEGRGGGAAGSAMVGRTAEADRGDFKAQATPAPDAVAATKRPVAKKAAPSRSKTTSEPKLEQQTKSGKASAGATSGALLNDLEDSPKAAEEAKPAAPDVQAPTVQQLHTQARAAAARSDCTSVKALARKIAAKDAPYYRANIAPDAALAACLN